MNDENIKPGYIINFEILHCVCLANFVISDHFYIMNQIQCSKSFSYVTIERLVQYESYITVFASYSNKQTMNEVFCNINDTMF